MGCVQGKEGGGGGGGGGSNTLSWNEQYERARQSKNDTLVRMNSNGRSLRHTRGPVKANEPPERRESFVEKQGGQLTSVNGYDIKGPLGKGAFGEVFLALKDGDKYAIKVLHKQVLKRQRQGRTGSAFDSVKTEIATMRKLAHPNLVHMYDIVIDLAAEDIFIVLEYVDGGTSQAGIDEKTGKAPPLKEQTIWSHMRHLILGLEYLHMQGIVHRDIKPENILMTKPAGKGALGMCKIADFGTSCLCEGDANAQKTAGTPAFFAPELCSMTSSGTYDGRSTDLWAVGVTAYLWVCGRMPFSAPTTMLLMKQISECPAVVPAPKEASSGLKAVIESLMTRDLEKRLTLNQLRLHPWVTENGKQPLPQQPVTHIEVTAEELEKAFSNRAAIAYQSAAGPSALGRATGYIANWKREGLNTIRKRSNAAEAHLYQQVSADGHLSHHVPVIYSVTEVPPNMAETSETEMPPSPRLDDDSELFEVRMQDLAAGMTRPCAMGIVMGNRTVTPADLLPENAAPSHQLLQAMREVEPTAPTSAEAQSGVNWHRFLSFVDEASSTKSLGFRIDAARTVVNGELGPLPLPNDKSMATLREESDVVAALSTFMQHDVAVCKAVLTKLDTIAEALERSAFFKKHVLLRSSLLLLFDDAARDKVELKMINFGFSYALPDGETTAHTEAWFGSADSHEDGYLTGVKNLIRLCKRVEAEQAAQNRSAIAYQSAAGPSTLGKATGFIPNWKREGTNTIRKRSNEAEATMYRAISTDAHLSQHVPTINSVTSLDQEAAGDYTDRGGAAARASSGPAELFEVRMQDLAAGMTRPCAMGFAMGSRTVTPADLLPENAAMKDKLTKLDAATSTKSLGFRIDAARTVVDGELGPLPLPKGQELTTLKDEADVIAALSTFLQHDTEVCKLVLQRLESIAIGLERSAFFARHVLLRSSLLLVFDDAQRSTKGFKVEFKMINFGFSYALPGSETTAHTAAWDGSANSHEDGYLTGVKNLVKLLKKLHSQLEIQV